jgi:hypothetical protein
MADQGYPVSDEDRAKLFEYTRKWQDLLSLHRWRITPSKQHTSAMAELNFSKDNSAKLVRLRVGKYFGAEPVTNESLEMTAIHELIHVLLYEFKETCKEDPYNETRQMEREHDIVHVLEKLLYELWHCKHAELPQELPDPGPKQRKAKSH